MNITVRIRLITVSLKLYSWMVCRPIKMVTALQAIPAIIAKVSRKDSL